MPTKSLTVAVLNQGLPVAYGIVANISEGGVCIQTSNFSAKSDLSMVLSFTDGAMVEASGRVAWSTPPDASSQTVTGVEFTQLSEAHRKSLHAALDDSSFAAPEP